MSTLATLLLPINDSSTMSITPAFAVVYTTADQCRVNAKLIQDFRSFKKDTCPLAVCLDIYQQGNLVGHQEQRRRAHHH